ncbi:MAG: TerB N-terminal domain-containing protein [Promethearchaeota archaeon]
MSTTLTIVAENFRNKIKEIGDTPLVIPKRFENIFPVESVTVIIAYQGSSTPNVGDYISFQIYSENSSFQKEIQSELYAQIDEITSYDKLLRIITEEEVQSILQKSPKEIDQWAVASVLGYYSPRQKTILKPIDSLIGKAGNLADSNSVIEFLNQYMECLFHVFPLKLINYLVYNSIQGSKFCQRGNTKILEGLLPKILKKVNNHFLEVEKKKFLNIFPPQTPFTITQETTNINELKHEYIDWLASNKSMVDFLTDMLKYTEKRLSLIVKYRGKVEINPRPLPDYIKDIVQHELKKYEKRLPTRRELNQKQPTFAEFEIGFTPKKEVKISIVKPEVKPPVRRYERKEVSVEAKEKIIPVIRDRQKNSGDLEAKMKLAAQNLDFKEASRIREKLAQLESNHTHNVVEEPPSEFKTPPVEELPTPPKFVPFDQYWPTLDTMNDDQRNWYNFWVSEIENGHYYPTDLSYIFLLIYQALDYDDTEKGYRILRDLWIHYRREHPKLDRYLINWITDYILLHNCHYDQKTITRELVKFSSNYTLECLDSILTLFSPRFKEIPVEWINVLANNSIKSSTFYSSKPKVIDEIIPEVLEAVDRYYHEAENLSLLEKFKPEKEARFVFDKALKNEIYLTKTIEVYPYTTSQQLLVFITEIVMTTESMLRKYYRFPALPHISMLEREIEKVIETIFTKYISELSFTEHETELSFIDAAQKYVNRVEDEVKPVPLYQFQPNYHDMTNAQLKWYFYWRNQVKNGNFLSAQLGYIILYIYEIINDIGIQDPQEGYKRLLSIWEYYRIDNTELDDYFPEWIAEYSIINNIPVDTIEELYHTILSRLDGREQRDLRYELTELLLSHYQNEAFNKIPIKMLYELVGYLNFLPYTRLDDSVRTTMDLHVKNILNEVNTYYLQKHNKGLLEFYSSTKKRRIPFVLARYFGETDILEVKGYSRQFLNFLDNTIRFIHNRFRDIELDPTKTRLKVAVPDPEVEALIDYYFIDNLNATNITPKYSKIALQVQSGDLDVDQLKIKALTEESDEIQTLLTTSDTFEQEETTSIIEEVPEEPVNQGFLQEEVKSELDEWNAFSSRLTDLQHQVLRALVANETPKEQLDQIAEQTGTLPEAIIESINEIALETIDDIIIDSDLFTIIDEYLDMIKTIVKI